jgi:two-component system cell cycle response regulator/two-component system cell cycle response regulator DivK
MSGTVLVVEDEADVMLTYRIILQTAGYDVVEATTGEEALSILDQLVPDAMILDLRLPGIDGWQVLATIRLAGLLATTPIVIASANALPGQQARADELGCAEVFTKPFSAETLLVTLARVLALRTTPAD